MVCREHTRTDATFTLGGKYAGPHAAITLVRVGFSG
jgi:hypothetical protein